MSPRVSTGWQEFDSIKRRRRAFVQLHRVRHRLEMRTQVGSRHRALVRERIVPLGALHMDSRVRKNWHEIRRASTIESRQTRCMIEVKMREHDVCDLARINARLRERIDGRARRKRIHRALFVGPLVAATSFDEYEAVPRFDEERACHERNAIVGICFRPLRPHRLWDESEHATAIKTEGASGEGTEIARQHGSGSYLRILRKFVCNLYGISRDLHFKSVVTKRSTDS